MKFTIVIQIIYIMVHYLAISFHADSVIKLYKRFKEVVDDYIELKETIL